MHESAKFIASLRLGADAVCTEAPALWLAARDGVASLSAARQRRLWRCVESGRIALTRAIALCARRMGYRFAPAREARPGDVVLARNAGGVAVGALAAAPDRVICSAMGVVVIAPMRIVAALKRGDD